MEKYLEMIIARGIKIGTIQTLKSLGLLKEVITVAKAEEIYGERLVNEWRKKGWVVFYPSNNNERGKRYCKLSELETASAMLDLQNKLPENLIKQLMDIC